MDEDGYPTEEELATIEKWDAAPSFDFMPLVRHVQDLWSYPHYFSVDEDGQCEDASGAKCHVVEMSTGGWSGNESLLEALSNNNLFWSFCWYSSKRGGHHVFHVPIKDRA